VHESYFRRSKEVITLLCLFVSRPSLRQARAPYRLRLPPGRPPTAGAGPPLPPGLSIGPLVPSWLLLRGMRKGVRCRGGGFCRVGREVMGGLEGSTLKPPPSSPHQTGARDYKTPFT